MGFIHGCNICNTPKDIGEIDTKDIQNKIIYEPVNDAKNVNQQSNTNNLDINRILMEMNVTTSYDIEFPKEIMVQNIGKTSNLKHEKIKYNNDDIYEGTFNENINKKEEEKEKKIDNEIEKEEEIEEEMNLTNKVKEKEKEKDSNKKERKEYVSNEQMIENGIEIVKFTEEETNKVLEQKAENKEKKKK